MTNSTGPGKQVLCDLCGAASKTYDRKVTYGYIEGELKQAGWRIGTHTALCQKCLTPTEKYTRIDPPEGNPDVQEV